MRGFAVYFDESGDEGFEFNKGSKEWFILSAVINEGTHAPKIIEHYAAFKKAYRKAPDWYFHFATAKHDTRVAFLEHICELPLRAMSVAIHKPSLTRPENFQRPYYLYFFAAKYLLERVSSYVSDHNGKARLIFSSRKGLRLANLHKYLRILKTEDPDYGRLHNHYIKWPAFDPKWVEVADDAKYRGLQFADAVASGLAKAIEKSKYGRTEHRYIKILRPITHFDRGSCLGYGLKFFPRLTPALRAEPRFHWLHRFE